MILLDGKNLSQKVKEELKTKVSKLKIKPKLVVIQVGNDPASEVYVKGKEKASLEIGIDFELLKYPSIETEELKNIIIDLNNDAKVSGMIVQLPLPKNIDVRTILDSIDPKKDVDGLTTYNIGSLETNTQNYVPCTPKGIIKLLEEYNIDIQGKHVVIVGRSNLVGKPLIQLFLNKNATVTVCHSYTNNLKNITLTADILVAAVGKKYIITEDMIKNDATIIDVGINRVDNKLFGDVDFDNVKDKCSFITPVPGGVGPMTIAMLLENVVNSIDL